MWFRLRKHSDHIRNSLLKTLHLNLLAVFQIAYNCWHTSMQYTSGLALIYQAGQETSAGSSAVIILLKGSGVICFMDTWTIPVYKCITPLFIQLFMVEPASPPDFMTWRYVLWQRKKFLSLKLVPKH